MRARRVAVFGAAVSGVVPTAAFADGVWTGAGPDANWSTPQNWDNNRPPAAGASLTFPGGSARPISFNDLPAQTYSRVTLSGWPEHTIEGNGFTVNDGLIRAGSGIATVNVPVG